MIKILIADDEGYERDLLSELLDKRLGREAEVRAVENGRLAVDAAALWAADVALMDIEMPGLSGIDAAKQILAQRPECKIIFITAYSLFTYAHEAVKLGACDYILKPVDGDEVERAVRRAAAQAEAQRQLEAMASSSGELLESADSYDKTAVLMGKVKKYLQHNYMMYDISPGLRQRHSEPEFGVLLHAVQADVSGELSGLPHRAAHGRRQGAAGRPPALHGGGGQHGGL